MPDIQQILFKLFASFNGFLLICALFIPLERIFHLRPQKILRQQWRTDTCYYFLSALVRDFLLAVPFSLVILAFSRLPGAGLRETIHQWPIWLHLLAGVFVGEIGAYWGHRLLHTVPFLWRFHAIHHSAEEMDWLVNIRIHPLETVFLRTFQFIPLYALGFINPGGGHRDNLMLLLIPFINALWGYFIHANVKFRFGLLEKLITTPVFHHWHHTNDSREETNKNYSFMLPVMDMIFLTFYLPKGKVSRTFGVNEPVPETLGGQLLYPFLPARERSPKPESHPDTPPGTGDAG